MRSVRLFTVVLGNLRRSRNHFLLASIGIVVGIATFAFFLALGLGVRQVVLGKIFPLDKIEVIPRNLDVDVGPLFSTPEEVAAQAADNDVHVVGVSSLAAGHLTLVPALRDALAEVGRPDIMIVVGGVIPPGDFDELYEAGAAAIFPPGTVIADSAVELITKLADSLGLQLSGAK